MSQFYTGPAVHYGTPATQPRLNSPDLWRDCPIEQIMAGRVDGKHLFDDFLNLPYGGIAEGVTSMPDATDDAVNLLIDAVGGYHIWRDTGATFSQSATDRHGAAILSLSSSTTDNDELTVTTCGNTGTFFIVDDSSGSLKDFWFECRIKKSTIADDALAMFIGFTEQGLAATNFLADNTGALPSKDLLGFHVDHADGELVDWVYRLAGQNATVPAAAAKTLTADSYTKLGMRLKTTSKGTERIELFVDGVRTASFITDTNIATSSGSAFPDAQPMCFTMSIKCGTGSLVSPQVVVDWWRFVQLG